MTHRTNVSSINILRGLGVAALFVVASSLVGLVGGLGLFPNGGRPVLVDGVVAPDGTQFVLELRALGDAWVVDFDVKKTSESWRRYVLDSDDIYWYGSLSLDPDGSSVIVRNYDHLAVRFDWKADRFTTLTTDQPLVPVMIRSPFDMM